MAIIEVKTDPQLEFKPIEEPMSSPSPDQDSGNDNQQVKTTGIVAPLIKLNNTVIPFDQVTQFELGCENFLPTLFVSINDKFNLAKSLDQPKGDNIIQIQILPPFDNAYKKINMNFFISNIDMSGDNIYINGIYKVPELYNSRLQCFGELTTYEYIEQISNETKLGFATNISGVEDKRFIYCNNINYIESIERETQFGGSSEIILQSWIDYWNYINLADIFERYNSKDENLKVWISTSSLQDTTSTTINEPQEMPAQITNNPALSNSQLYCKDYSVVNNTGVSAMEGTDRVLSIYDNNTTEVSETLLQDGDISNDLFTKYLYLGELYSEHNYLLSKECNRMYKEKLTSQAIVVNLSSPLLGLMRGHKVNFLWYDNNDLTSSLKTDIESNLPVEQTEYSADSLSINKQVSGQYLIYKTKIMFDRYSGADAWKYQLTLIRPQSQINSYINE